MEHAEKLPASENHHKINGEISVQLDTCPAAEHPAEHPANHPHCGYQGCVDLRLWANANRYRFRFEESYKAESDTHVRGDGR